MKTINWQTKALTLFIAAAALWLIAACDNADTNNVSPPPQETTETSIQEATEAPTQEPTQTSTVAAPTPQVGCTHETPGLRNILNTPEDEYWLGRIGHAWLSRNVREKYQDLLWRQPNVYDVSVNQLLDGEGAWTKYWGITVWVTEKVDQNSLPPEDRIPSHLQDVPIQIIDAEQPPKVPESNCDYSKCGVNLEKGEEDMTSPNAIKQEEQTGTRTSTAEMLKVRDKYEPLFNRQPNVYSTGVGYFTDENGEFIDTWGIVVSVTKKVDQSMLPPEDRIPDCLEGIPVQIEEIVPPIIIQ